VLSILEQDVDDFELILIDNNSTDSSRDIALEWEKKDGRIKLVEETKQGVMYASNKGAKIAQGEYVSRMDADDWAFPDKLRIQANFLDNNIEYGAVAGLVEHIPHSGNTEGFARYVEWSNSVQSYEEIFNRRFIESPIVNPSAMWRRTVGEKHGLYKSGDFPEDYEMWLRWLDQGVKIKKLSRPVLKWYDSDTRLTRTDQIYSDTSFYKIKSRYLAKWLEQNNPQHPYVSIWGASRISRRRARLLEPSGVKFKYFIDTKKSRQIGKEIIYYENLPAAGQLFILTYIKQMNNREKIMAFLEKRGYVEGKDYLVVS
ncbi:glycosyltransferase family 2 protein, partial [Bacteroidota bacterium]